MLAASTKIMQLREATMVAASKSCGVGSPAPNSGPSVTAGTGDKDLQSSKTCGCKHTVGYGITEVGFCL